MAIAILRRALPLLLGVVILPVPGAAQSVGPPTLQVGSVNGALQIDGRLTEPDWMAADSIATLTEVEPVEGGVAPARTVVRVLASSDAIVIGVGLLVLELLASEGEQRSSAAGGDSNS